jgi:hypothetical protein
MPVRDWPEEDAAGPAAEGAAANALTTPPARAQPSGALLDEAATVPSGFADIADEAPADPDAPTYLSSSRLIDARSNDPTVPIEPVARPVRRTAAPLWFGQRPRKWGVVLTVALLLLAGTATLTLFAQPALFSIGAVGTPTLGSAESTRAAGQLAHLPTVTPRPTATHVPPTPTFAGPARLTATPNPLALGCTGAATLTLTNSGGQAANWSASASFGARVAPGGGTLEPGRSAYLTVTSNGAQRGSVTIRWTGGSIKDAFRVTCHG